MKTRISVFITAITFLLLGTTSIVAQDAKAYFKKDGVTVFESAVSEIDNIVFKQETTTNLFVPLNSSNPLFCRYTKENGETIVQKKTYGFGFATSLNLDNLIKDTKYYIRPFVKKYYLDKEFYVYGDVQTFQTISDWVLINGVKWATRNVSAPGTFVQNTEGTK